MDVAAQFSGVERVGVTRVGVEGGQERGPLLHDADASVRAAMDASFVTLGQSKGAFEVEVVCGQPRVVATREEAGGEGVHDAAHMGVQRVGARRQKRGLSDEFRATLLCRPVVRLQARPDRAQCQGVLCDLAKVAGDVSSSAVDAVMQLAQGRRAAAVLDDGLGPIVGPPFFGPISRSMES